MAAVLASALTTARENASSIREQDFEGCVLRSP
jgi:hypothetical protein